MRHTSRPVQVAGAVILSATVGIVGMSAALRSPVRAETVRSTLIRHEHESRPTTPAPRPVGGSQTILVAVPSIAVLELDGNGRIIGAATNTGRPPASGDVVYVRDTDGSYQPSDIDVAGRHWRGDFSESMRFQRQSGDEHDTEQHDTEHHD